MIMFQPGDSPLDNGHRAQQRLWAPWIKLPLTVGQKGYQVGIRGPARPTKARWLLPNPGSTSRDFWTASESGSVSVDGGVWSRLLLGRRNLTHPLLCQAQLPRHAAFLFLELKKEGRKGGAHG